MTCLAIVSHSPKNAKGRAVNTPPLPTIAAAFTTLIGALTSHYAGLAPDARTTIRTCRNPRLFGSTVFASWSTRTETTRCNTRDPVAVGCIVKAKRGYRDRRVQIGRDGPGGEADGRDREHA
jgi:hypothetical protein